LRNLRAIFQRVRNSLVVDREYNYLAARIEQHCAAHLRLGR